MARYLILNTFSTAKYFASWAEIGPGSMTWMLCGWARPKVAPYATPQFDSVTATHALTSVTLTSPPFLNPLLPSLFLPRLMGGGGERHQYEPASEPRGEVH